MIIIQTRKMDYPGAWDNWALPEYYTQGQILENGKLWWCTVPDGTQPNATPEQIEEAATIVRLEAEAKRMAELEREAKTPRKGRLVRVVRGRKVPKGTEGRVFWYDMNQWGWSCGIELQNGERVFTSASNVEAFASAL